MCGIVGYVGNNKTIEYLINGLKSLEYRGYDSAGIAYVTDKINIIKKQGKLENLKNAVDFSIKTNLGIGHTRWATNGIPNEINAHPHQQGNITLVHNGIIENYEEIKNDLKKEYTFKSETDTEVIAALIDSLYKKKKDMLKVLKKVNKVLKGSYALGIINDLDKNHLYILKKDSPLIIGKEKDGFFIASDVPAILKYTNEYFIIENNEIGKISCNNFEIYDSNLKKIEKKLQLFEMDLESSMKNGYKHFMLKEINEQPFVIEDTISSYIYDGKQSLKKEIPDLSKYEQIHIVACGSAYHTGLVGSYLIEKYGDIPVSVEISSEYRYKKVFYNVKTIVIFISQSGETADTLACLRKVKDLGIDTLAIVNVVGSSIAREADKTLYIKAGCEIAVATTKAYLAQAALLSLIGLNIAINKRKLDNAEISEIFDNMKTLPNQIKSLIENNYLDIAKKIKDSEHIYFIARGIDSATSKEGALKLKEISYIHCEAYAAGELKHGSISLIEKDTKVIAIITDKDIASKTINNIKEVKARGAKVILVVSENLTLESDCYDELIKIPETNDFCKPILAVIPLQLIAYNVALLKGCEIDKPRNLAKSVTVE